MGRIVVGTSSWADPGFVAEWYPPDLPARDRLAWYAERFEARGGQLDLLRRPGHRPGPPLGRAHAAGLHLRRQAPPPAVAPLGRPRLAARKPLREEAETTGRAAASRLDDRLEEAVADGDARRGRAADRGRQAGDLPAPALARLRPARPRARRARAAARPLAPHPVAVELRNRSWTKGDRLTETLGWLEEHDAAWVVRRRPARRPLHDHAAGRRGHRPARRLPPRARPQPRGLRPRPPRGRALRVAVRRRRARGDRRARAGAGREGGARCG